MDEPLLHELIREYALPTLIGSGGLLAWLRAWWRRRKRRLRLECARADAVRKLLDAARYNLYLLSQPDKLVDKSDNEERVWELRHDIDDVREELWVANGNTSKRERRDV